MSLPNDIAKKLQELRVIYYCLTVAPIVYLAWILWNQNNPTGQWTSLCTLMMIYAALSVGVRLLVPLLSARIVRNAMERPEWNTHGGSTSQKLIPIYGMMATSFGGIVEGPIYANLYAYSTTGNPLSLGIAGFMLLVLLLSFPTSARMSSWIQAQLERVESMKAPEDDGAT